MNKKLMTWNPNGVNGRILFVLDDKNQWVTYTTGVPKTLQRNDITMKSQFAPLSKGYATMQNLLKLGWKLVDGRKEVK